MTTLALLERLRASGIILSREGDRLKVSGPPGALNADLRRDIADRKAELLRLLSPQATAVTGLEPIEPGTRRRLSPNQERLWSLIAHETPDDRYNLPFAIRLRGPLDVTALRRAISCIVARHEVLRGAVRTDDTGVWVEPDGPSDVLAVERAPTGADDQWIQQRVTREAEAPFALEAGETVRALLLVLGNEDHLLTLTMHHFAADGASFDVFFDELSAFYAADQEDQVDQLPSLLLQYHDFAAWRHRQVTPERRHDLEAFWLHEYEGAPSSLRLPRPDVGGPARREERVIPESIIERVMDLASVESTSPLVVTLAAYGLLMAHLTNSWDVILCSPTAGRDPDELEELIGYFNNVLPLRLRIDPGGTVRDSVRATRRVVLQAHAHEALPFQDIAALSTTQRLALTRGMFVFHGQPMVLPRFAGVQVERYDVATRTADFDVGLTISRSSEQVVASLNFRSGALGTLDPTAFLDAYVRVLDGSARQPDVTNRDLVQPLGISLGRLEVLPASPSKQSARPGATGDRSTLPKDPLELQLAVIWERVLEVRGISASHDFFDLGGHSLLAVRLLDMIERETGRRLALSSIAEYPTVEAQARALRNEGWSPPSASLVPMYDRVAGDPVVMLHSFEGHTFLFNELARRVGREVPTYGMQAQGLAEGTLPHSTVEEMATHYLDELENRFGGAPIALVGMCFGNSLGLEMATRRAAQRRPVQLILIDGAWEHLQEPEELGPAPGIGDLIVRRTAREVRRVRQAWDGARRSMSGSAYARREAAIRSRTARAWKRYTPRPYAGEITLIRAHDTAENPEKDWHVRAMSSIAQGGLRTVTVPGHHFTILREPQVEAVAEAVLAALSTSVDGI